MIRAYTGLTGSGKTLSMVIDAANFHLKFPRRKIFSNFKVRFPFEEEKIGNYTLFGKDLPITFKYKVRKWEIGEILKSDDFIDVLMQTKDGLFLVDEAGFVFNNRKWRKLPFDLVARFQQSRKIGVDIFYTTQAINRVDLTLRELTHIQVMCNLQLLPFTEKNLFLHQHAFFNPIIGHDSLENRKLYHAYSEFLPWFIFEKYYNYYDTLEIVDYSVVK